jgi:hypothetical protein
MFVRSQSLTADNNLKGTILSELGRLPKLTSLNLSKRTDHVYVLKTDLNQRLSWKVAIL